MDFFTVRQASKLVGISPQRLRRWEKIGFIPRTIRNDEGAFYSFQDLVTLKAANELISGGISLKQVLRSLELIRKKFPGIQSLSELKFFSQNSTLLMRYNGVSLDPVSGQIMMNFDDSPAVVQKEFKTPGREKDHLFWFEYALRFDVEGRWKLAIRGYRKALQLNPTLADCWNNLATIYYRLGRKRKAIRYYLNALKINPSYKLAYYNLGNIFEEIKKYKVAIKMYRKAIELDPQYYDAHYNLGLVYDKMKSYAKACQHWEIYFQYDSASRWARYARERMQQIAELFSSKDTAIIRTKIRKEREE